MNEVDDNCGAHIPPSICANRDQKKKKVVLDYVDETLCICSSV
jgi:hypothetical protein